ncbi:hypothetical protein J2S19_003473 [Metabacillus malikii]|uniref:Uncharacterized protein n=1 Tax=Metabacillus malikii TaxID=1504265 RepID=A0ABT9ZIU3_9BACI|nr:hypothetical protein [Metabacillus malikii]
MKTKTREEFHVNVLHETVKTKIYDVLLWLGSHYYDDSERSN